MNLGGVFLEGGGVEMNWWGMEGLLQVSFLLFLLLLLHLPLLLHDTSIDDHVYHHICTYLVYYAELTRSSIELASYPSHARMESQVTQPPTHEPIDILVHSSLLLLRGRRRKFEMKRNASTIPRRRKT